MNDAAADSIALMLRRIADGIESERASIGSIMAGLGARAHGLALLLFAAPNLTPGPSMPGFSTVLAIPLVIVAAQMVLGLPGLWLPGFIARRTLSRKFCTGFVDKLTPIVVRIDRVLRPRLHGLTTPFAQRLLGLVALAMAALLLVPLPFYPLLPAFGMVVLALGLLARDGAAILAAILLAVASGVLLAVVIRFFGHLLGLD